jgi:hypothetical protein
MDEVLEGELAGVLALGGLLEEAVEGGALESRATRVMTAIGASRMESLRIAGRAATSGGSGSRRSRGPAGRGGGGAGREARPERFVAAGISTNSGDIGSPP